MYCYVDESWHESQVEHVGVLAGVIAPKSTFQKLGRAFYQIRRKYYTQEHARDLSRELSGSQLFSNLSFKHQKTGGYSKNLSVAREVLVKADEMKIRIVGITVYGETKPTLLSPSPKRLDRPFKELCRRIIAEIPPRKTGTLIFDQRLGAQEGISIAVYNYLAGLASERRLDPHAFVGVSNVFPGIQLADIVAHVLGRYATGDVRFDDWYKLLRRLQMEGTDAAGKRVYGLMRLEWSGNNEFKVRRGRTKK